MLLVLPLARPITKKAFPIVTFVIVLLNCLVYLFAQTDDQEALYTSFEFYFESGLAEIEIPAYPDFIESTQNDAQRSERLRQQLNNEDDALFSTALYEMASNRAFDKYLAQGHVFPTSSDTYSQWMKSKAKFLELFEANTSYAYGLRPAELSPITLLTYQFLHGSPDHLLGNMVFLGMIGVTIEMAIGGGWFVLFYLIAGICAGLAHGALDWQSVVPLVGASGSIAGLMGLYTLLFGLKKIRIFYFFFIYFGYAITRALLLLPVWLLYELIQFYTDDFSNVAYMAHVGGIVSGAVLGLIWRLALGAPITEVASTAMKSDPENTVESNETEQSVLAEARREIAQMNFVKADMILTRGRSTFPHSFPLLFQQYCVRKCKPKSAQYLASLKELLDFKSHSTEIVTKQAGAFADGIVINKLKPKLSLPTIVRLCTVFIQQKRLDFAEQLVKFLMRSETPHPQLPYLTADLANALQADGQAARFEDWVKILKDKFPDSDALKRI